MTNPRSEAARLLGSMKSDAKTRAARLNAKKPRGKWNENWSAVLKVDMRSAKSSVEIAEWLLRVSQDLRTADATLYADVVTFRLSK